MKFNNDLTQEILKKTLWYNPLTGVFERKARKEVAGTLNDAGYIIIDINGVRYSAHRLAWLYVYGVWPTEFLDHIDKHRSNNKIANLREVNKSQNMQNQTLVRWNTSTNLLGTSKFKDKFQAHIKIRGKKIHLGTYNTAQEAHDVYLKYKKTIHTHGV